MWNFLECWTHREWWLLNYIFFTKNIPVNSNCLFYSSVFPKVSLKSSFHLLLRCLWWCCWGQLFFLNTSLPFVRLGCMWPLKTCISYRSISKSAYEWGQSGLKHCTAIEKQSLHQGICNLTLNQQSSPRPPSPNNSICNIRCQIQTLREIFLIIEPQSSFSAVWKFSLLNPSCCRSMSY